MPLPHLTIGLPSFSPEDPGGWDRLLAVAQAADRAGVDRVVVSDHVAFGEHLEAYGNPSVGGQVGGTQPTGPDGHWLEPLTVLTFVAATTTSVRLGTSILIAALRRPVVLAKTAATLDVLSSGRLDLGVGVGWQREEYEAAGLSFEDRGRLLDHTLEVCRTLWRDTPARYEARELRFDAIHQMPKPLQPGGVPVWVSGTINRRTVHRLATFGSGWIPWGPDAKDPSAINRMKAAVEAAGRDASDLQVVGPLPAVMGEVGTRMEAGVTDFRARLRPATDAAEVEDQLHELVQDFRTAAGR